MGRGVLSLAGLFGAGGGGGMGGGIGLLQIYRVVSAKVLGGVVVSAREMVGRILRRS